jgi:cell volume regulation protein A
MTVIQSGEASTGHALLKFGENFGLALIVGLIAGWVWIPVLRMLSGNPFAYPVTLAALLFLYVIVDVLGGNPAMAVLTFSVVVGNAESLMKRIGFTLGDKPLALDATVVTVHTQATFFIKSFFFTYIGLRLSPPWYLIIVGIIVGVALYLTRIPAAMIVAGSSSGFDDHQRKMITISLPRGMAAGVLATLPYSAKYAISGAEQLTTVVFAAIVTSIAIFAYGFRQVRTLTPMKKIVTTEIAGAMPDGSLSVPEVELVSASAPVATRPSEPQNEPQPPPPLMIAADVMPNGMPGKSAMPVMPVEANKPESD